MVPTVQWWSLDFGLRRIYTFVAIPGHTVWKYLYEVYKGRQSGPHYGGIRYLSDSHVIIMYHFSPHMLCFSIVCKQDPYNPYPRYHDYKFLINRRVTPWCLYHTVTVFPMLTRSLKCYLWYSGSKTLNFLISELLRKVPRYRLNFDKNDVHVPLVISYHRKIHVLTRLWISYTGRTLQSSGFYFSNL